MKQAVFLMLVLLLASCASVPSTKRSGMEAAIREAVLRHEFAEWKRPVPAVYFLDVSGEDEDPTDEFIQRFAHGPSPVKKCSQGKVSNVGEGVKDIETGAMGVIFRAGSIAWISDLEVKVSGGFYENGQSASGNTYTVRFIQGQWKVVGDKVEWIARAEGRIRHGTVAVVGHRAQPQRVTGERSQEYFPIHFEFPPLRLVPHPYTAAVRGNAEYLELSGFLCSI